MLCPFTSSEAAIEQCLTDDCALWTGRMCVLHDWADSLSAIAMQLEEVNKNLESIANSMPG